MVGLRFLFREGVGISQYFIACFKAKFTIMRPWMEKRFLGEGVRKPFMISQTCYTASVSRAKDSHCWQHR